MHEDRFDRYDVLARGYYQEATPPDIDYLPSSTAYPARIALIGCCGETLQFLTAYLRAGYDVAAIVDVNLALAASYRDKIFPKAKVSDDYRRVLDDKSVNFVALCVPVEQGFTILDDCLRAGKNVLIQKYAIRSLDYGESLKRLADDNKVRIAVNHDARWAPSWRYATQLVRQGYIGEVSSFRAHAIWNHNWVKGTELENYRYNILYYFSIHWFDIINVIMENRSARTVFSYVCSALNQIVKTPLLSETVIGYPHGKAGLSLDGDANNFNLDRTVIFGEEGVIVSDGPDRHEQDLWFLSRDKVYFPCLTGDWLPGGFHGTMAELIKSVEENREPENGLDSALKSLSLCFAALSSVETGQPVEPGVGNARQLIIP